MIRPVHRFTYSRSLFLFRTIYISVFFASIFIFLALMIPDMTLYYVLFSLLYGFSLIMFGITPLFTHHEISPSGIVLRQGLLFKISIGWNEIHSVEMENIRGPGYGVTASVRKPMISLATQKTNTVIIHLNEAKRFPSVLFKNAEEILIDVNDPTGFVKRCGELMERRAKAKLEL